MFNFPASVVKKTSLLSTLMENVPFSNRIFPLNGSVYTGIVRVPRTGSSYRQMRNASTSISIKNSKIENLQVFFL